MITCLILMILGLLGLGNINSPALKRMVQLPGQTQDRPIFHEDDGSGLSFEEDRPRIDLFAENLKRNTSAKGYIIAYGGLVSYKNEAAIRLRCIRNHLIAAHKISPSRVKMIDGGYRVEVSVRLYLVNPGDSEPTPYSIVKRESVQMRKAPKYPCGKTAKVPAKDKRGL